MIRSVHLTKRYGERTVANDLNLHVHARQVYALLGSNGAGKSTTIACLLGCVKPDLGPRPGSQRRLRRPDPRGSERRHQRG